MNWFTGCSGFNYADWKENFYPRKIKSADWLTYYSTRFNSVELNGTFYRFPVLKNLQWFYHITPKDFVFSAKAHRIITHRMRMRKARDKVAECMNVLEDGLREKLHCTLFQLPGNFKYSEENLENILHSLPPKRGCVVEFRHVSWWRGEVFRALKKNSLTFCNVSFPGLPEERHFTSKLFYMRFHGVPELFCSSYPKKQMAKVIEEIPARIKQRYVYFNNTAYGNAHRNAAAFIKLSEKAPAQLCSSLW